MKHWLSRRAALVASAVVVCFASFAAAAAQPRFSQPHGLYDVASLTIAIEGDDASATIHYTTDGSEPTPDSPLCNGTLTIKKNTLLRAIQVGADGSCSPVATATYLFVNSVLSQSNTPNGYPKEWGAYTDIWGTAIADYEMDPEMTSNATLRQKIAQGLHQLPILSIVTDRDNLFSHENDPDRGGIYIFTGPPVGDPTGHGWTRPASIELFSPVADGSPDGIPADFSTTCGLRLHGGHGRLAEKNPKHSFRLVFKEQYGPKSLKYPLFGIDEPQKFDQLVLRCHFGNSWQHWAEGNRQKAQYTRDVWARRMQRRIGRTSVNARYVNLFLNGMYWGIYNLAERVDDQYGKDHLGGDKADIDVVKIEEDGGNHLEATEGTFDAYQQMVDCARAVGGSSSIDIDPDEAYQQLKDSLLDIDAFIDYMLINQYGGNTDWDHHNWYAIRRRGADSQGFRFLCWDTEIIFENERENVLQKNNGSSFPTGIFHNLLKNDDFARRYLRRAKELLADDGFLGQESVVAVWDSLYNTISSALYCEAARWGDYRRDVHPWQQRGQLYTVDETYMAERDRLLTRYFPVRSGNVLNSILAMVDIDDFEMPDGWQQLTASMFHEWNGTGANATPLDKHVNVDWNFNTDASGGTAIAGFVNVAANQYADVSAFDRLVLRGRGNGLRILANRLVDHGPWKEIKVSFNSSDPYWDDELEAIVLPLSHLKTAKTNEGKTRNDAFVHLHVLKVDWSASVRLSGAYLLPSDEQLDICASLNNIEIMSNDIYDLQGRKVQTARPRPGIYVVNGKKVFIR